MVRTTAQQIVCKTPSNTLARTETKPQTSTRWGDVSLAHENIHGSASTTALERQYWVTVFAVIAGILGVMFVLMWDKVGWGLVNTLWLKGELRRLRAGCA